MSKVKGRVPKGKGRCRTRRLSLALPSRLKGEKIINFKVRRHGGTKVPLSPSARNAPSTDNSICLLFCSTTRAKAQRWPGTGKAHNCRSRSTRASGLDAALTWAIFFPFVIYVTNFISEHKRCIFCNKYVDSRRLKPLSTYTLAVRLKDKEGTFLRFPCSCLVCTKNHETVSCKNILVYLVYTLVLSKVAFLLLVLLQQESLPQHCLIAKYAHLVRIIVLIQQK